MNIGMIGLGDIARKAYLPVITNRKVDLHLCSRNAATLADIGKQYRISNLHNDIDSLINAGITAAFVHTATSSHEQVVRRLLENNIHVYVDKPVTDSYDSTASLVAFARSKNLLLKAGFNRRYAPAYAQLKDVSNPNMILMQKNRKGLPGNIRTFIYDDFIHVVDTLLFLLGSVPAKIEVTGRSSSGMLHHVVINITAANGTTAIGIMNRDNGTTEESLEVFSPTEKRVVLNLTDTTIRKDRTETKVLTGDWQPMLRARGFENIIDDFIGSVKSNRTSFTDDILQTHKVCEDIVRRLTTND